MNHLVIHRHCIEIDLHGNELDEKQRGSLLAANNLINNLLKEGTYSIIDWNFGSATAVDRFYNPGDEVTLYGAYVGECLRDAKRVLENKGVKVYCHDIGCITID